jgi:hypothetical protein
MTYMEKVNVVAIISGLGLYAWYVMRVAGQIGATPLDEISYRGAMGQTLLGFVVFIIVGAIIIAILDHKALDDEPEHEDERDHTINQRGDMISGNVLGGFVVLVLIGMIGWELHAFWIANALMAAIVLSGVIGQLVKLIDYRRG